MSFLINIIVSGIAVYIAAFFTPWVVVDGILSWIIVSLVLWLINATIGNILRLLTLPLNFLTLGLIWWIINFLMLILTDKLIDGFEIHSFLSAVIFSILLSIISGLLGNRK